MGQLGFLKTHRGRNGGLELGAPATEIQIGQVFRAMEAPVPLTECFADTDNTCPLIDACRLRIALADACETFYAHLDGITLDSLVCDNPALLENRQCRCRRSNRPGNSQAHRTAWLDKNLERPRRCPGRRRDNDLRRKDRWGITGLAFWLVRTDAGMLP